MAKEILTQTGQCPTHGTVEAAREIPKMGFPYVTFPSCGLSPGAVRTGARSAGPRSRRAEFGPSQVSRGASARTVAGPGQAP